MAAEFSVTGTEAQALLDWMGNNGIDSDVSLYDGGVNDYTGEVFFGFEADVTPTVGEVIETLERAAHMVAAQNPGLPADSLTKRILNEADVRDQIAKQVEVMDGWASVRVVFWNVTLV